LKFVEGDERTLISVIDDATSRLLYCKGLVGSTPLLLVGGARGEIHCMRRGIDFGVVTPMTDERLALIAQLPRHRMVRDASVLADVDAHFAIGIRYGVAATASLAGVGLPQRRPQIPDADLGVDRRRLDAAVTEETLDVPHVGAAG